MAWATSDRRDRLPPNWLQLRRDTFELKGRLCLMLRDGVLCGEEASDIDHIVPSGPDAVENLQPLCRRCHKKKSSSEGWNALRKKKAAARERAEKKFSHEEAHPGANPETVFVHPWMK